ncbi:MAG TPA: hypothetical protein VFH51_08380, partial [Myxococcota bacterium]|nr:hypothetical protein [Myxococcota bacterium]
MLTTPEHVADVTAWRTRRAERLTAPDGWLALAGLHWLQNGTLRVGSAATADIPLPASAPAEVGTLVVDKPRVRFEAAAGAGVSRDGAPVQAVDMQ